MMLKVGKVDPAKLVGRWTITMSSGDAPVGTVVEFTADGKRIVNQKVVGTYVLNGDSLFKSGGVEAPLVESGLFTIIKLTDDELVTKDKDEKVETMKRVKP